jgi:hypothetical protein
MQRKIHILKDQTIQWPGQKKKIPSNGSTKGYTEK